MDARPSPRTFGKGADASPPERADAAARREPGPAPFAEVASSSSEVAAVTEDDRPDPGRPAADRPDLGRSTPDRSVPGRLAAADLSGVAAEAPTDEPVAPPAPEPIVTPASVPIAATARISSTG